MYGVIGEDKSDFESLKILIKRITGDQGLTVKGRGFGSCDTMLKKGAQQLKLLADFGMTRFIVCYDSDGHDPAKRREEAMRKIIGPSKLSDFCITIPVQELESWILADFSAVTNIFRSWKPERHPNPENVESPKEFIVRASRDSKSKTRYSHATHNPRVARHLDLDIVYEKCASFRPFRDFVKKPTV
jgi:hypothetical protein